MFATTPYACLRPVGLEVRPLQPSRYEEGENWIDFISLWDDVARFAIGDDACRWWRLGVRAA